MGDMSEMRGVVIVLTFLTVVAGFILFMPPQYLQGNGTSNVASYRVSDLMAMNQTSKWYYNFTGDSFHTSPAESVGGYYLSITETSRMLNNGTEDTTNGSRCFLLEIKDAITWLDYYYNDLDFQWFLNGSENMVSPHMNVEQSPSRFDYHYVVTMEYMMSLSASNILFSVQNDRATFSKVYFTYDPTLYTDVLDAYNHMGLSMILYIDFSERNTQVNTWSFIISILMINTSSIQGLDTITTWLIRTPIIACLLYLAFIFVLRVIGAIFGGGA